VSVAVAWVLAQSGITSAIVGASKPEQLGESLAAVNTTLDEQDIEVCNLAWLSLPRPAQPSRESPAGVLSPTEGTIREREKAKIVGLIDARCLPGRGCAGLACSYSHGLLTMAGR